MQTVGRGFFGAFSALSLALIAGCATSDHRRIHADTLVLDSHADILLTTEPSTASMPDGSSRVSVERLKQGEVDAIVLSVAVVGAAIERTPENIAKARQEAEDKLIAIKSLIARNPDDLGLALSADDVRRLEKQGKVAIIIGFQNAFSIGKDISQIDYFYDQGVRVFGFNHASHNDFSDSSRHPGAPASENGGLSPLGREAVKKLNDLGVLIDVSQLSDAAFAQTLELTRAPVAATHSASRAIVDHPRNLSDDQLDAIKRNGGVVQVVPFWQYIVNQDDAAKDRVAAVRASYGLTPHTEDFIEGLQVLPREQVATVIHEIRDALNLGSVSDLVDHIEYIGNSIGWDHVGIGSDFNHGGGVNGYDNAALSANVTAEFVRRGYSKDRIAAIWGGNFLRVLAAAEAARRVEP